MIDMHEPRRQIIPAPNNTPRQKAQRRQCKVRRENAGCPCRTVYQCPFWEKK